ncbi:MAG: glycogen debranching protein GlgX [Gammaproteobacteria bacterium]|nr:glycogen debranching protein GlgX [Gammaproteobacteria bacterium]
MEPGSAYPLGASYDGRGINFALFSAHAERVELCVFDTSGSRELHRLRLPEYSNEVWHGYLPDFGPGTVYGYRVFGPYKPRSGHRFNHHKLLLDPYARCLVGRFRWSGTHYAYRLNDPRGDMSFDERDNAQDMYKAMVVEATQAAEAPGGIGDRPRHAWRDSFIYEAHVRGLTRRHPDIPEGLRGTIGALAQPAVITHLQRLGATAIELLPVHAFIDEHFLIRRGLRNYWGYNSIGFFAPMPRYLASSVPGPAQLDELKGAVRALHEAGLEVILDVVYNHTAEGNELGPSFSFKGIDNRSYYHLSPNNPRFYENHTGCGNALNLAHPRVAALVMDSLRYWAGEIGVDGFRFDLASTLARESSGFDAGAAFLDMLAQDPLLARCKLIAEPWDIGPGGYQLGGFPAGWAEWNDQFRDTVRRFWRGDEGQLPVLARRLHGSSDLFEHHGRRPHASLNFVTSHDGFTLQDQVSYLEKHNEANGEQNQDGHPANFSQNFGVEGLSDDPRVARARRQQRRNLLATLLLAEGTPMLLAGDEMGRTQLGNNNAYCQDNEIAWLDWSARDGVADLSEFIGTLARIRRESPVLRRDRFVHGAFSCAQTGFADIAWYGPDGRLMSDARWTDPGNRCLGMLRTGDCTELAPEALDRLENGNGRLVEPAAQVGQSGELADAILLIVNAGASEVDFQLPAPPACAEAPVEWRLLLSTAEDGDVSSTDPAHAPAEAHAGCRPQTRRAPVARATVLDARQPLRVPALALLVVELVR